MGLVGIRKTGERGGENKQISGQENRAWGQDQTKADESISSSKKEAQSNDDEKAGGGGKCVKGNMIEER